MKIAVLKEAAGETRCAATPDTVKRYVALGAEVEVERGAGEGASIADAEIEAAGAKVGSRAEVLKGASILLSINGPDPETLEGAPAGALLVGALDPLRRREAILGYAAAGLEALAMEWMPRITRAQSMDILSSQSNLAGYKAVVDAAAAYGRAFPMMMTAAGTVSPAKVFVMGVGVAGLQAIATARRLGAQASATDVRSATKEQIQSLGAKPIFVENVEGIEGEGAGGYATEMSEEYQKAQAELVSAHIAKQDIVITTALIPGRPAPRLINDGQIASMRPGSVIVDLAADAGGNVEGTESGKKVVKHGVTIIGASNLASSLAADASALFARNLYNFLSAFWDKERAGPLLPGEDEIVKAIRLTQDGKIVNERLAAPEPVTGADILVVGGGIAGLSAAASLSAHGRVLVLEAEEQIGYHSSGRSATMVHYALGDRLVRALTLASRSFFDCPPDQFSDVPLGHSMPVLVHAREEERSALDSLAAEISLFARVERLDARGVHEMCPLLKDDALHGIADRNGTRLDPHALLQANLKELRRRGGELRTGCRVAAIGRGAKVWTLTSEKGESFAAPILVNAAGSWADQIAGLAGVRPIGLEPKRRTIITFDAPNGLDLERLPFAKTVGDDLYFAPESGRLFASPMDEIPSEPSDAQPDEYEIALAAYRMEERTTLKVEKVRSSWAGLRTFTSDRRPVVGFANDAEGFFWLAGQGGFGLQTSPAIAAIAASLVTGGTWPLADVSPQALSPDRFLR